MDNQTEKKWYQKPFAVVLFLIFFFPVGLFLMWKHEVWSKTTRWIISAVFALAIIANAGKNESSNTNSNSSSGNNYNASEEVSKKAYRQGYADGQMGYGLPASERATAMESYMAHNYNYSSADISVYEMGYNDAISGKSAQY